MTGTKVRWGILGTATIAREAVIPAMRKSPCDRHLELTAIASRQVSQAEAVAKEFGIERAYGSYDALLAEPEIDAVYIPLPNHLHVPLSIRALEAGKHVLCEKPIARNATEAAELVSAAKHHPRLKVMEAFMYRFHPQWQWVRETLAAGTIGELRGVQSSFTFFDDNPASILHNPEWGGGALLDIGCYSVSLSRLVFGSEPRRVLGSSEIDPRFGVDRMTAGMLEFAGGVSTFMCATQAAPSQRVQIWGTRGRIELETPFNPSPDRPCRGWLARDSVLEEVRFEACDQYGIQMDLFSRAILDDAPVPTPLSDAMANMQVIDALVRSARNQQWESVGNDA